MAREDPGAPSVVRAMWGHIPVRRGRKPGLALQRIAHAGVAIADEQGLAALRMSRVAERLGVSTMALYRYVHTKDELLLAMDDAAVPSPPVRGRRAARAYLTVWTVADRDQLLAHPWRLDLPRLAPPLGPGVARWWDAGLAALRETGLSARRRVRVVDALDGYAYEAAARAVREEGLQDAATPAGGGAPPADRYARLLTDLVDAAGLPALADVLRSGGLDAGEDPLADESFGFGVRLLLDGLESRLRGHGAP